MQFTKVIPHSIDTTNTWADESSKQPALNAGPVALSPIPPLHVNGAGCIILQDVAVHTSWVGTVAAQPCGQMHHDESG